MIERLPTPWGLVRLGVAPDHPKIKSVSRAFERIAEKPGFRFLGNVEAGRDLGHDDLCRLYDAVVYAVGAQTDRRMGIPGEDLPGSWPATEFVAWYNGHPDYQELEFDLDVERAVVVGAGNVAVDVARMLALTPEELDATDTTDAAIAAISGSSIKEIVMVARRGPVQAAFTTPGADRARRARRLPTSSSIPPTSSSIRSAEAALAGDTNSRRATSRCCASTPRAAAARAPEAAPSPLPPLAGRPHGDGRVEAVELVRNRLEPDDRGTLRAVATGRARDDPVRARLPQRRLPGRPRPGRPLRRPARDDPERGRPRPRRDGAHVPASTAPAGSSAARAASSARTRRTRPRPSSCCSPISATRRARAAPPPRSTPCSTSGASAASSTPAGAPSTRPSAPPARSSAGRA